MNVPASTTRFTIGIIIFALLAPYQEATRRIEAGDGIDDFFRNGNLLVALHPSVQILSHPHQLTKKYVAREGVHSAAPSTENIVAVWCDNGILIEITTADYVTTETITTHTIRGMNVIDGLVYLYIRDML